MSVHNIFVCVCVHVIIIYEDYPTKKIIKIISFFWLYNKLEYNLTKSIEMPQKHKLINVDKFSTKYKWVYQHHQKINWYLAIKVMIKFYKHNFKVT